MDTHDMDKPHILVVDDDKNALQGYLKVLSQDQFSVQGAATGYEALKKIEKQSFDIVISDIRMPQLDGITLLREIQKREDDIAVILVTAFGTVDSAVEAMKLGAETYLTKPVNIEALEILITKIWEKKKLYQQNRELKKVIRERYKFSSTIGNAPQMQSLFKTVVHIAPTDASVLIQGETGTGKELFANLIHYNSDRSEKPFVALHCAALSEGVLESELFGHEKGAFTGAIREKPGRFAMANGGSLFLDEVGEMSQSTQVKLLRVIDTGEFERVGGEKTLRVDVRIIAATNKNLEAEVKKGNFREDLLYRINVIVLNIPPLRERKGDIPLLADYFLQKYTEKNRKPVRGVTPKAVELLQGYDWPGNVRELENVIERAVILCKDDVITPALFPAHIRRGEERDDQALPSIAVPFGIPIKEAEKMIIQETLRRTKGNRTQASKLLGMSVRKIVYLLKGWKE
jgi:DNA-binding NtrC family response regulator